MRLSTYCLSTTLLLTTFCLPARAASFRVPPYVQNPAPDGMSIIWFSNDETPGQLTYRAQDTDSETSIASVPVRADALAYLVSEDTTYFGGQAPPPPFRHRIRLDHLKAATTYAYRVDQGTSHFSATFNTAPKADEPIRFIAYADCETEPESTGKFTEWIHPLRPPDRLAKTYLLDQTTGYAQNLAAISDRHPNFIAIAGDLVESGGENNAIGTSFGCTILRLMANKASPVRSQSSQHPATTNTMKGRAEAITSPTQKEPSLAFELILKRPTTRQKTLDRRAATIESTTVL